MKKSSKAANNCILTLLILLCCCKVKVFGQTGDPADVFKSQMTEKVKPISPNTASFEKVALLPANLSTGTAEINIPVFTVMGKKLSLPISLSYSAKGMKVDEDASWVGLGWNLDAGGIITQQVIGMQETGMMNNKLSPERAGPFPTQKTQFEDAAAGYLQSFYTFPYGAQRPDQYIPNFIKDPSPDIYTYSFCGESGKFVLKDDGSPVFSPRKNYKVIFGGLSNTTIIDDKGNKYIYTQPETSWTSASASSTNFVYATYLTQIISADGSEVINLSYISENHIKYHTPADDGIVESLGFHTEVMPFVTSGISVVRLSEINTNFGIKVKFVPDPQPRQDLQPGNNVKALSQIEIYQNEVLLKTFKLTKEYVKTANEISVAAYPALSNTNLSYLNYRLYLNNIQVYNSGQTISIPPYSFEYYGRTSNNLDSLPNKFSFAQDHWGFYNGQLLNPGLCPGYSGYYSDFISDGTGLQVNYPYANREPDFLSSRCGVIKRATYPTGGKIDLVYEPHSYTDIEIPNSENPGQNGPGIAGGVRIKKQIITDPVTNQKQIKEYTYSNGRVCNPLYSSYIVKNYEGFLSYSRFTNWPAGSDKGILRIGANSLYNLFSYNGSHIYYENVTEKEVGNGYSTYVFSPVQLTVPPTNEVIHLIGYFTAPVCCHWGAAYPLAPMPSYGFSWNTAPPVAKSWLYGQLLSKSVYNESNQLLSENVNKYNFQRFGYHQEDVDTLMNTNVSVYLYGPGPSSDAGSLGLYAPAAEYYRYPTYMGTSLLTQNNQAQYDLNNNKIETTNNTTYNSHLQPYIVSSLNSDGTKTIKKYKYPYDYDFSCAGNLTDEANAIKKMVERNMVAMPVEEQVLSEKNGVRKLLGGRIYGYVVSGDNVYIRTSYTISTSALLSDTTVSYIDCSGNLIKNSAYTVDALYNNDNAGNVNEAYKPNGSKTSVIWKQNSKNALATISGSAAKNIFYENFEDGAGNSSIARTGHMSYSGTYSNSLNNLDAGNYVLSYWLQSGNIWTYQKTIVPVTGSSYTINLTGQIDDVCFYPAAAQMTTYTYDPLLGMTSMTDVRGNSMFYEYDSFQRLINIRDQHGYIKTHYCYNYAGQVTDCATLTN